MDYFLVTLMALIIIVYEKVCCNCCFIIKWLPNPEAQNHIFTWKAEACDAVRNDLCSHDDERVWPIQCDQHNRVCDVYKDWYKLAYVSHYIHSAHMF